MFYVHIWTPKLEHAQAQALVARGSAAGVSSRTLKLSLKGFVLHPYNASPSRPVSELLSEGMRWNGSHALTYSMGTSNAQAHAGGKGKGPGCSTDDLLLRVLTAPLDRLANFLLRVFS
jgi:hypothetical protein